MSMAAAEVCSRKRLHGKSRDKQFGRYEVVGELGRGAMGVVYKARDPQIDRLVALKTVPLRGQEPEAETEFRMRFLNEAQAAGRLHHPGIVAIFDVGENPENQDPYIVLEYVAGESLNRILAREKKLPLATALQFAEEIAEALGLCPRAGRDSSRHQARKHSYYRGRPRQDCRLRHREAESGPLHPARAGSGNSSLHGAGTTERRRRGRALGSVLAGRDSYAMVTGHSPFQGNSATTVCFKVANREPVAASALDLTLPPELDAVIARAMAKDPAKRYQRGAEFAADLRQLQQFRAGFDHDLATANVDGHRNARSRKAGRALDALRSRWPRREVGPCMRFRKRQSGT